MEEGMKIKISADVGQAVNGINQVNSQLKKLTPASSQAGNALRDLGRVASDAPFGFVAISNNLDPLLQSFVQLKKEAGSAGGALKALGASLLGGNGLALGFTAVTAAITYFSLNSKKAKEEVEGLAKAQKEANKGAGEELAQMRLLVAVAQDTTRATNERLKAVKALQITQKETFGNLSKEIVLNGDLTNAIQRTTEAIIQKARATAYSNRLAELSAKELDNLQATIEAVKTYDKALKDLKDQRAAQFAATGAIADISLATKGAEDRLKSAKQALEELAGAAKDIRGEQGLITDLIIDSDIKLPEEIFPKEKKIKVKGVEVELDEAKIKAANPSLKAVNDPASFINLPALDGLNSTLKAITEAGIKAGNAIREGINTERLTNAANAINDIVSPAFTGLFNSIIDGSQNAFQAVGQFLKDIIKKIAAVIIQAASLAAIMNAIGIGPAGSTFGSLFRANLGFSGLNFKAPGMGGVGNSVARGAIFRSQPQEVLVSRVSGKDLDLILQRTWKSNNRLG